MVSDIVFVRMKCSDGHGGVTLPRSVRWLFFESGGGALLYDVRASSKVVRAKD
jgi:hypothetical protein